MEQTVIIEKLEKIARPVIEGEGLILYDLEYKRENTGWVVRFYILRQDGNVSIDDCVKVSRQLNVLLDVEDPIGHPYNLEVSSPGLTRSLKKLEHYSLSLGESVKLKTKENIDGRKIFHGKIESVEGENIVINEKGKSITIPFNIILSAKLDIEIFKGVEK